MHSQHTILVVEDSDEDFYTTKRILKKFGTFPLSRCTKGADVIGHLNIAEGPADKGKLPSLILLDLNLPGKKDGRSLLAELKRHKSYCRIPVVVLTTSDNPHDLNHCYRNGASGYVIKPVDLDEFTDSMRAVVDYWFDTVVLPPTEGTRI